MQDALCSATVSEDIQVFSSKFPNIITPNDDGINDDFAFPGLEADGSTPYDVKIYDRLGNSVYESTFLPQRLVGAWSSFGCIFLCADAAGWR